MLKLNWLNKILLFPVLIIFGSFLIFWVNKPNELKNGIWRATIERQDGQKIVFNFLSKDSAGKKIIYVINGKEHLLVDSIETRSDSVFIQMPFFESGFKAKITSAGNLQGEWIKHYGERVLRLPFEAEFNNGKRFDISSPPTANISGKWVSTFKSGNRTSTYVTEFKQDGAKVSGTVLDPTGDFRFLDGVISGDSLKLSTFDGANAYLLTAKIDNENKISGGMFYSGATGKQEWSSVRNENAKVTDNLEESKSIDAEGKLNFSFPDSKNGKMISINDKRFKNKVVVVQILGSWCPNCMDETKFLSDYYNENHQKGFEVIGLAYERTTDFASSQKALMPFEKRLDVKYPILITGVAVSDTNLTQKTLPQIEKIKAFPTSIIIDKKGNIRKIESGFNGPATGEYYVEFKKEFNQLIEKLLAE
ncbi:MAG: TlpA disulfide reductase family protein [Ginsengibacter sp.]